MLASNPELEAAWSSGTLEDFSASYELAVFDDSDARFYALQGERDVSTVVGTYLAGHLDELARALG